MTALRNRLLTTVAVLTFGAVGAPRPAAASFPSAVAQPRVTQPAASSVLPAAAAPSYVLLYIAPDGSCQVQFCRNDPVNVTDPTGLAWNVRRQGGSVVAYYCNGWDLFGEEQAAVTVGDYAELPEVKLLTGGSERPSSVSFTHDGVEHEMDFETFWRGVDNIPDDLSKQMLSADAATRKSLLYDFLLKPVPSGGMKAHIAGVLDATGSVSAGSTGGDNPLMNVHGSGGPFQKWAGVDSRSGAYSDKTKHIGTATHVVSGGLLLAGAYVSATPQGSAAARTTGGGKNVRLYHKGEMQGGNVSAWRELNTTRSAGSAEGYERNGHVWSFDVPDGIYQQWLDEGTAQPFQDVDLPSGGRLVSDAVRVRPPRSGELNQYRNP